MFLNRLTIVEKVAFLNLAHRIAGSDNDFHEQEKIIIGKYCMEMQVDDIEFDVSLFGLEKTLSAFQDETHQKIALLEIMALVYSDDHLDAAEDDILGHIVKFWELNPNLVVIYKEWAKGILALLIQGEALIHI